MAADGVPASVVLDVVARVAAVERLEAFGNEALQAVHGAVPFDEGSYNEVDTADQRAMFTAWPEQPIPPEDLVDFPRLVRQNPVLQYQERTGDPTPHRISDFLSAEELHRQEFYQRIFAPRGLEYQVALAFTVKRPLFIALALNRCHHDFSDYELTVLDALRPHLAQAHRNVRALSALRGIDDVLAESGRAMVVLDTTGDPTVPPWAADALQRHFGADSRGGLPAPVAQWIDEERHEVFDNGAVRIHRPLEHVADGRQLVLRYIPATAGRTPVVVLEERSPDRRADELARLGLTRRERQVLDLVGRGRSSSEIAEDLGVRRPTVDKHLEHIYRKLGVNSRTAAVAAAADAVLASG